MKNIFLEKLFNFFSAKFTKEDLAQCDVLDKITLIKWAPGLTSDNELVFCAKDRSDEAIASRQVKVLNQIFFDGAEVFKLSSTPVHKGGLILAKKDGYYPSITKTDFATHQISETLIALREASGNVPPRGKTLMTYIPE